MSRRARQFLPSSTSPAHTALRAAAVNANLSIDTVREILAVTNADCDLIAFAPTCENLIEIVEAIESVWQEDLSNWGLDAWIPVLNWVLANRQDLKAHPDIGAKFDPVSRAQFPHKNYGVLRHPFYAMLWFTHPDGHFRERHRLAQAQLLTGVIQALRNKYRTPTAWASMIGAYESYFGRQEWKPLENSLQAISMLGRRLSSSTEAYAAYLKWLPVERTPTQFIEAFFTIGYPTSLLNQNKLLSERHTHLRRFLDKLCGRRRFQAHAKPISGERFHGNVEREITEIGNGLVGRELTYLDASAPSSGNARLVRYTRCIKRTLNEIKAALDADDDPFAEEQSDEDIYTVQPPEDKKRNVSFTSWSQVHPITMKNQLLPCSYSNLAPAEAKALLREAERWLSEHPSTNLTNREMAKLEILTFALTMLATGSSRLQAQGLVLFPAGSESRSAELSLLLPDSPDSTATWRIASVDLPYHFHREEADSTQRKQSDYIFLPDIWGVDRFVQRLVEAKSLKHKSWSRRLGSKVPFKIYRAAEAIYGDQLQRLFEEIDPAGRTKEARVAGFLFSRLMSATNGDVTLSALVAAQSLSVARTRLYYACVRLRRIQDHYVSGMKCVHREIPQRTIAWAQEDIWITTRPCPTQAAIRRGIGQLLEDLGGTDPYRTNDEYVAYHNSFTLYSLLFVFYATAQRGTNSPMLRPVQINAQGFVWINDKETGYNSRLVWCPEALIRQVRYYAMHVANVRREVVQRHTYAMPTRREFLQGVLGESCFFLKPDSELGFVPARATRKAIEQLLRLYVPYAINVHRRCVSGDLLDAGVDPQLVDWWMSHWHTGEEPWNTFSGLSPAEYAAMMKIPIESLLLQKLGFRPKRTALQVDENLRV